jgi:hypothetical protein
MGIVRPRDRWVKAMGNRYVMNVTVLCHVQTRHATKQSTVDVYSHWQCTASAASGKQCWQIFWYVLSARLLSACINLGLSTCSKSSLTR